MSAVMIMDAKTKEAAAKLFGTYGLSLEEGTDLLLRTFLEEGGLPIDLRKQRAFSYRDIAMALSGDYYRCYYVNAKTGHFFKYSHEERIDGTIEVTEGDDFFSYFWSRVTVCVHPADVGLLQKELDKDALMERLQREDHFEILQRSFEYSSVSNTAIRVCRVKDHPDHFFLGIIPAGDRVRREGMLRRAVAKAKKAAKIDGLTGVYNTIAYKETRARMNAKIRNGKARFAVVVLDLNDLKLVNDTKGHLAGDAYIKEGVAMMQRVFSPSKIYRIGGDEFAIILERDSYGDREFLVYQFVDDVMKNREAGRCVVAIGMADFDPKEDRSFSSTFLRADAAMYENKQRLKNMKR